MLLSQILKQLSFRAFLAKTAAKLCLKFIQKNKDGILNFNSQFLINQYKTVAIDGLLLFFKLKNYIDVLKLFNATIMTFKQNF